MRLFRGLANAVLMATLIKPVVRLSVRRWRKQAQESPAASIGIPVQELVEAALIEELAPLALELEAAPEESLEEVAGRSAIRTLFIAGIAVVVISVTASAIVTVIRRRREAQKAKAKDFVTVPVETAAEEAEELEALVE